MAALMVQLDVVRLEMDDVDSNHFKHYTAFCGDGYAIFGYSRIGTTWQWTGGTSYDAGRIVQRKLNEKRRKGYRQVWAGVVDVPSAWVGDPRTYGRQLQDFVEDARQRSGSSRSVDPATVVSDAPETPLGGLLLSARNVVSKMAVDPDSAVQDYSDLVGQVEAAQDDLDTVVGYMDTLRLMLAGQEARMG